MPNAFDEFGFAGDEDRAVTDTDRADPTNAGLSDQDIVAARRPAANPFEEFGYTDKPEVPVGTTPEEGYSFSNLGKRVANRAGEVLSQSTIGLADTIGDLVPDWMNSGIVWDEKGLRVVSGEEYDKNSLVANVADVLRDPQYQIIPHKEGVTFDQVKAAYEAGDKAALAQTAGVFALESGITSLPDMIAMLAAAPAYFSGLASEYTQQRAANQGHEKPTAGDVAAGTATAAVVATLEKFGAERVLGVLAKGDKGGMRRFLEGIVAETGTEAVQSPAELLGTQAGTPKGVTGGELAETSVAGALGGLGGGVALGGPVHGFQAMTGKAPQAAPNAVDAARDAPPQLDAVETARAQAKADAASRGADALTQEVAGALAAAEASAHKRGAHDITARQVQEAARQLQVEEDYAVGGAQVEEDAARQRIQEEAAARYAQGQPAPAPDALEVVKMSPEVRVAPEKSAAILTRQPAAAEVVAKTEKTNVFEQMEREAATTKDADFARAEAQKTQQEAEKQVAEPAPLTAPMSEFKTLAERRAAQKPTVEAGQKPAQLPESGEVSTQQTGRESALSLPAPRTARVEVNAEGVARNVSEAEMESRTPRKGTLTLAQRRQESAPIREAAPRTLAERRAQTAQSGFSETTEALRKAQDGRTAELDRHIDEGTTPAFANASQAREWAARKQARVAERAAADGAKNAEIESAAAQAASSPKNDFAEPTQAQRDAGNYKKGHVKVAGMDISIETPKGGIRTFRGGTGQRRMRDHYGYVRRTEGADGDHVDVFLGDKPESGRVFVIDQVKQEDGTFDEHKAMVGYSTREDAVNAYRRNYQSGWRVGPVTEMSATEFKKWAETGDTKAPLKPAELRQRKLAAVPRRKIGDDGRLAEGDVSVKNVGDAVVARSEHQGDAAAGGFITAHPNKDTGRLQIEMSSVPRHLQGQRRGIKMMEALAARAAKEGLKLVSDTRVSEQAQQLYKALERRGYTVKQNPATRQASGELVSNSELKPVFEVTPPVRLRDNNEFTADTESDQVRVSVADAKAALKPLFDEIGTSGHEVIAHPRELPKEVFARQVAQFGERRVLNARGLYDSVTDTVWVFAGNHQSADGVIKTALHEIVAHRGVKKLLGKDYGAVMHDVYKNAADKAWMRDYATQHGLDVSDPAQKALVADEYIASIAERDVDQTTLQKVIAKIREILRKLGVVDKWTEADIRHLLAASRSALHDAHVREANKEGGRLADGKTTKPRTDPAHPNTRIFKMAVTAEEQSNYNPGIVRSRMDAIRDVGDNAIPSALALIPLANLQDFIAPGKMPAMPAYVRLYRRLSGRRSELLQKADETASRWLRLVRSDKDMGRKLGELMHAATLAGTDPAAPFKSMLKEGRKHGPDQIQADAQRRAQHAALKRFWNALSPEAQSIYIDVRESYSKHRDLVQQGLEARINSAEANGKTKQALIAALREKFESGKVAGPYFPLARFGKHWASAKDADGNTFAFIRREKTSEQRAWQNEMRKAGYKVDGGVKADDSAQLMKRVDPGFVAKIAGMLDEIDPSMADDVWQQYLRALPEMSMRKHYIHRTGRLGFTADALRAFAHQQFHSAHQVAKLENMATMDGLVEQAGVEAAKLQSTPDEKWAAGLRDELGKRHQWVKNPQSALWATKLTGLGFAFYLGVSPAAALVNLTQTPIVAFPTLAAKHGWTGAGTELLKSSALWAGSRGPLENRLRGDELKAFEEAKRVGLFSQTQAHDLAGVGAEGSTDYGSRRQQISSMISWMFHKAEEANRQITFLAAYRLGRKKGQSHDDAVYSAENLTWDSHFDYANTNRPRILQNDTAKVLFLFRQYSLNMTYRLARDFNDGVLRRAATPELKKEAATRFAGILGQTFMFAGVNGLPLFWLVEFALNNLFGDEDEPFDTDAAMRTSLAQARGTKFADAVMTGPVSAMAGVDLSSRVGLNNLWLRDKPDNARGAELGRHYLAEAAGPLAGMFVRGFDAFDKNEESYTERATELVTPKAISDVLKAHRYLREGVQNLRGDTLVEPEELTNKDLFVQSLGFVPTTVSRQHAENRAKKGAEQHIIGRRTQLMNRLSLAVRNDDSQMWTETMADINKFNKAVPSLPIDAPALIASAKARSRYSAESIDGVRVEKGLRYLHGDVDFQKEAE